MLTKAGTLTTIGHAVAVGAIVALAAISVAGQFRSDAPPQSYTVPARQGGLPLQYAEFFDGGVCAAYFTDPDECSAVYCKTLDDSEWRMLRSECGVDQ